IENRKARFKTVIALNLNGEQYLFEGKVEGVITKEQHGEKGFGYDPIFLPDGFDQTFAEMPMEVKNKISHRGRATQKLVEFLMRH
ncbi:MAG: non-canonical purine NTP pyrophosphatase, partial [Bacteroidales bacterium]|nr:non-canonical purine NTP pyrophosphatase [Bacteroidales bacterium]